MTIEQEPEGVIANADDLLLSRDRKPAEDGEAPGDLPPSVPVQLSLDGVGVPPRVLSRSPRRPAARPGRDGASTALTHGFVRRLTATGASAKTRAAYLFQLDRLLAAAHRHGLGAGDGLAALFRDEELLGRALIDDVSESRGTLSRWTLAQRRTAVRAFARLMAPELRPLLPCEPDLIVVRALRRVTERVGGGYRLTGGTPRRRGGPAPNPSELAAIIAEVGKAPGFKGARNRAFFTLLYETGTRVNALRGLDGERVFVHPGGRIRLMLHAKGHGAQREVELSERAAALLTDYVAAFGREAVRAGRGERVEFRRPGPIWRSSWRGQWAYDGVVEAFARGCFAAGTRAYTVHALRRAFATDAASALPRHVVARAGGWQGLERLDNHYIRPREETVRRKLTDGDDDGRRLDGIDDAATPV
jgi:integrase